MDPGRAQAGSWATRIGLVAAKVPFELGRWVARLCFGAAELSVSYLRSYLCMCVCVCV